MFLSSDNYVLRLRVSKGLRNTIPVSNHLSPDLGPNCLQALSAGDTREKLAT